MKLKKNEKVGFLKKEEQEEMGKKKGVQRGNQTNLLWWKREGCKALKTKTTRWDRKKRGRKLKSDEKNKAGKRIEIPFRVAKRRGKSGRTGGKGN